jgi:hypothetical protein
MSLDGMRGATARTLPRILMVLCFILLCSQTFRTRPMYAAVGNAQPCQQLGYWTSGLELAGGLAGLFGGPIGAALGGGVAVAAFGTNLIGRWVMACQG